MMKPTLCMMLMLLAVLIIGIFQIESRVQALNNDIHELNRQMLADKESLQTLRAEWAFLNQPQRLRELASTYLSTQVMRPSQVANLDTISIRPVVVSLSEASSKTSQE